MNLYRFYIYVVGSLPLIYFVILLTDPWIIVGFGYKFLNWYRQKYAKYKARQHTRLVFKLLKKQQKNNKYAKEAFRIVKKERWGEIYERQYERILTDLKKYRHPMEIEYERRMGL